MASHLNNHLPTALELPEMPEKSTARDRRKRTRAQVHWPLSFLSGTAEIIQTMTHNISSDGFYCIANARFVPGETRDCMLAVPTHSPHSDSPALPVRCKIRVIRVEMFAEGGFCGVGCQIVDYRFVGAI
jgi:PilZ domain